jgi:hypothetical protein
LDPAALPIEEIEVLFVLARGAGLTLEMVLRSAAPETDNYKKLRRHSAFRSKTALTKYLRRASPAIAAELLSRLKRGQLAFLPQDVRLEAGRLYLAGGYLEAPDLQSDDLETAALVFVTPTMHGNIVEILHKAQ